MPSETAESLRQYRAQLNRCARSLAIARDDDIQPFLPAGMPVSLVGMFTEGNLDKRVDKLSGQVRLLTAGFVDLDADLRTYVRTVPMAAYDTICTDADRFLCWLAGRMTLTPEQTDLVVCQRARHAVETAARGRRVAHLRFHDLRSVSGSLVEDFCRDRGVRIEINPLHEFARFHSTILLGDEDDLELPVDAVFFPVGCDVRTAVLTEEGAGLLAALQADGPCRLGELTHRLGAPAADVAEVCCDLVDVGAAAFR